MKSSRLAVLALVMLAACAEEPQDRAPSEWSEDNAHEALVVTIDEELGANDPNPFESEDPRVVILAPWTHVLTEAQTGQIVEVQANHVVFERSEEIASLEEMDVLTSYTAPHVFHRRVVSVTPDGAHLIVRTTQAELGASMLKGHIDPTAAHQGPGPEPRAAASSRGTRSQGLMGDIQTQRLSAEFETNAYKTTASFRVGEGKAVTGELEVAPTFDTDFGLDAELGLSGNYAMCRELLNTSTDEERDLSFWFWEDSDVQVWPAAMRTLSWAIRWSGNSNSGDDMGFSCTDRRNRRCRGPWDYTGTIGIRDEFKEAINDFWSYAEQEGLTDEFERTSTQIRRRGFVGSRAETLARYRELHATLDPEPKKDMELLLRALDATPASDDLHWLSMAPAIARKKCEGTVRGVKAHLASEVGIDVRATLGLKARENVTEPNERVGKWLNYESHKTEYTYDFPKDPTSAQKLAATKVFWIGWFPVVWRPQFFVQVYLRTPELSGEFGVDSGWHRLRARGGMYYDSTRPSDNYRSEFDLTHDQDENSMGFSGYASAKLASEIEARPTFKAVFYETLGFGLMSPIYAKTDASMTVRANRGEQRAEGCASVKAGGRIDLVGSLNNPLGSLFTGDEVPTKPNWLTELTQTLYDTCGGDHLLTPLLDSTGANRFCFEYSAGFSTLFRDDLEHVSTETYALDEPSCPSTSLVIKADWSDKTDLDLYVRTPSGQVISYLRNQVDGGFLDNDASCRSRADEGEPAEDPRCVGDSFTETVSWTDQTQTAPSGDYEVWVVNSTGNQVTSSPIRVDLSVVQVARNGQKLIDESTTLDVGEGEDMKSESFSFSVD